MLGGIVGLVTHIQYWKWFINVDSKYLWSLAWGSALFTISVISVLYLVSLVADGQSLISKITACSWLISERYIRPFILHISLYIIPSYGARGAVMTSSFLHLI